jgi:hypothetical protein
MEPILELAHFNKVSMKKKRKEGLGGGKGRLYRFLEALGPPKFASELLRSF